MSKEQEIIGGILNASTDFLATSNLICSVLEAVKEECRYVDTKKIDAYLIEEHDKRNLPHPDIIRRSRAIKQIPDLIKSLVIAAMKAQINATGELCIPPRDDAAVHQDDNVFTDEIANRYGIQSSESWKSEDDNVAEMKLRLNGELKDLFEKYGCGGITFDVSMEAEEDEVELVIDSTSDVDMLFNHVSMFVTVYPQADEVEKLIEYMKNHPNPNLLIHAIKYPKR